MVLVDTIVALSSGALPAGVAVIRLSGPAAFGALNQMLETEIVATRTARLVTIIDPVSRETLDRGLVFSFKAPHSFSGEDVVEMHLHGSRAVVDDVIRHLSTMHGVRVAEPGEFTHRAFLNGKMDLVAAEALGDLIHAQTSEQRRLAHASGSGALHAEYNGWRQTVLRMRSMMEADIDFADEDDVPGSVVEEVYRMLPSLISEIEAKLKSNEMAERVRDGFRVVIYGSPNAGKSTLLNALAGRDAAIVTDIPGTTRDMIEVQLDIAGFLVRVIDTAGIRKVDDVVEAQGVERAEAAVKEADLVLELSEDGQWRDNDAPNVEWLRVGTKLDLSESKKLPQADLWISAKEGVGIDQLLALVAAKLHDRVGAERSRAQGNLRHASKMRAALRYLREVNDTRSLEISAEFLRLAGSQLGELTGDVGQEEILGEIFSSFCIGK